MKFNDKIKTARVIKELSQAELATQIFVSRGVVRDWELKKSEPSCEALIQLSDFYQVSTDYILGITPKVLRIDHLSREQIEVLHQLIFWMQEAEEADMADKSQTVSIGKRP